MDERKLLKKKAKALNSSNRKCLAEVYNELGDFYFQKTDYEKALVEYKNSAKVYSELKMKLENAKMHRMVGEMYMYLAEYKKALKHNEIYLETVRELDNKVEEQRALATLGRVYLFQGENMEDDVTAQLHSFSNAEKSFLRSLKLCENSLKGKISNLEFMDMKARLLLNIGIVSEQLGNFEKAVSYFQKSINICKNQDLYDLLTQCYVTEGLLHSSKYDDQTKAIACFNMALNSASKLDNKVSKSCEILHLKAEVLCKISDFQSAKMMLMKAWKMKTPVEEERAEIEKDLKIVAAMCYTEDTIISTNSDDCNNLKRLYEKMGDGACLLKNYQRGIYFYLKTLEYAEKCGETENQLIPMYISLYQTYKDLKDFDKALEYINKEYNIIKSIPKEAFKTLLNIAEILVLAKKPYKEIEAAYEKARLQANIMGEKRKEVKCLKLLLNIQTNLSMKSDIEVTKKEIDILEEGCHISDDSSEELSEDSETPNIGDDVCLEDLTDLSDDEDYDKNNQQAKRKRGKSFMIKKNNKGETQLHQACISGNVLLVSRLLSQGHPVNIRDNAGWLPIHEACIHGRESIVDLLIKNGAHVNDRGGNQCDGITPICDAAFNGHMEVIKLLLDNGASPVIKTDSGDNPLDILKKWRQNNALDQTESALYESICSRMQKSLEKTGDVISNNITSYDSINKLPNSLSSPNKYNSLIGIEKQNEATVSLSYSTRNRNQLDEGSDSSDSGIINSFQGKSNTAVSEYKNAIKLLRKKSVKSSDVCNINENKKLPAIISQTEVGDDWLENDLISLGKKRRNLSAENLNPAKRKSQSQLTSPLKNNSHCEVEMESYDTNSRGSEDSISAFFDIDDNSSNSNRNNQISQRNSRKYKHQVSLMRVGFSRNKSSQDSNKSKRFSNEISENNTEKKRNSEEPDSTTDNHSSFSSIISSYCPPIVTAVVNSKQDDNISVKPPISVRIRIQEKTLLIPIPSEKIAILSVNWLINETCRRFYNLEGIRPSLNLLTNDGALLADDDPLSVVISSSELVANITNWNLPPLGDRYTECCSQFGIDADSHLKQLLEKSQATYSAEFNDLNLEVDSIKPIFKSLNHQNTLKSIILSNNSIGNEGVRLLCESLPTLSHIEHIDLSGNLIDANGIQSLLSTFEKTNNICPHFQSLNLNYNFLSNIGFLYLIKLSKYVQFKVLNVCDNDIELLEISEDLSHLQTVQNIDISNNNMGKNTLLSLFRSLKRAPLKTIQLENLNVHDILVSDDIFFSELIEINLSRCNINDSDVAQILRASSMYQTLERVNFSYIDDISFLSFKQLLLNDTINYINLEGCSSIFKYINEVDIPGNFVIGEKKNKLQYLKYSCRKNSIYYKYVNYLSIMWSNYWKEKSVIDEKPHGLITYSKS